MNHARRSLPFVLTLLLAAWAAPAQDQAVLTAPPPADPRIDAAGRAIATFPPDRHFDHLHMRLEIDIPDMEAKRFSATQTLTLAAIGSVRTRLVLDAREKMKIESVSVGAQAARFRHADGVLAIDMPAPVSPGEQVTMTTKYTADEPAGDGVGLNWFKSRPDHDPPLAAQIHSQGQANWNSYWFPCHDFPNERLTTELIVTVPAEYQVLSNGRKVSDDVTGVRRRVHWLQDKPHPAYLVTLVVGQFDIVDVGGPDSARPGLPMPVYGPPGSADDLRRVFAGTARMVKFYEQYFDEAYPWDQYAQAVVRHFRWGGMENTSASTLNDRVPGSRAGEQDDLIAHELAHQWTGNLLTCKSWEHLWLNEGFATFAEWLWVEETRGPAAYTREVRRALARHAMTNQATAPGSTAMVSHRYTEPDELFTKPDDPYTKGGLVLHMLRRKLGDAVFQTGVRTYVDRFKFQEVETDDFRKVMEEASGESLEGFFQQWTRRPGLPRLNISLTWSDADRTMLADVEQIQTVDGNNPAYEFDLPLHATLPDGSVRELILDVRGRQAQGRFILPERPTGVEVDPALHVAAAKVVRGDLAQKAKPKPADAGAAEP